MPIVHYNFINPETIQDQINEVLEQYCTKYNIDLYNYGFRSSVKHNEVNNILRYIYNSLFKVDKPLVNNQYSKLDYNDIKQLKPVVDSFINICMLFNKSLGLFSFSLMTGIEYNTIKLWVTEEGEKVNSPRFHLMKSIKDFNTGALVSHLKDSTVGALAVANNDIETGLEWAKNNAQLTAQNQVFFLPSERVDRLKLSKDQD